MNAISKQSTRGYDESVLDVFLLELLALTGQRLVREGDLIVLSRSEHTNNLQESDVRTT